MCFLYHFFFLPTLSLFPGSCSHPPSPRLPNSPSVQRQGTGSRHWLDFHTIPSTERHIKLIRVNNCGGALLSGAPISLAWPGSDHTDGLVISDLEAEGMERGGGALPPLLEGDRAQSAAVAPEQVCQRNEEMGVWYFQRLFILSANISLLCLKKMQWKKKTTDTYPCFCTCFVFCKIFWMLLCGTRNPT